jgi:signal transduction histidine kinase
MEAAFILQEALTNIRKHAFAQRIDVHLRRQNGHVKLSIRDNGQGFDPQAVQTGSQFGLQIMRERAMRVSGTLQVHTTPGSGTQIIAAFPVETAVSQPVPAGNGYHT